MSVRKPAYFQERPLGEGVTAEEWKIMFGCSLRPWLKSNSLNGRWAVY